jgi:hypothetical protein
MKSEIPPKQSIRVGAFNGRVFWLTLALGFMEASMYYAKTFLPITMLKFVSTGMLPIFFLIFDAYYFLLHFALFLVAFYYLCGKAIQEEPASTVVSLVLGGFAGTWLGGLTAIYLLTRLGLDGFNFTTGLMQLPYIMRSNFINNIVLAVASMLSSWFVLEWDKKLAETAFQKEAQAPVDIIIVSALYFVSGILSLCVLPLLILVLSVQSQLWSLTLTATLIILVLINAGAQIVIAVGLYLGKRWGWLLALTASLIGIITNISLAVAYFQVFEAFALTVITLALNIMAAALLLTTSSRQHCRIVNPTKTIRQTGA